MLFQVSKVSFTAKCMNRYRKQNSVSHKSEGTCTDDLVVDVSLVSLHVMPPSQQPPLILRLTCCMYVVPGTYNTFVFQADKFEQMLLQTGIRRTCGNIENMLLNIRSKPRTLICYMSFRKLAIFENYSIMFQTD